MIERCPAIDVDSDEGIKPEKISGELELRNVCFSYPARRDMQVCGGLRGGRGARELCLGGMQSYCGLDAEGWEGSLTQTGERGARAACTADA